MSVRDLISAISKDLGFLGEIARETFPGLDNHWLAQTHAIATSDLVSQVGVVVILLLFGVAVLALSKRSRLPFTVLLVVVGVLLAQLAQLGPAFLEPFADYRISPEVILFVFLPTLIYESAFNLDARQLRKNITPVLALAIPGLLLSTAIIGSIVAALTQIPFTEALLLGAILSATDPVAVISIFKQLGAPKRLTILVEGESLFNDATSIVVAGILLDVSMRGLTGDAAFDGVIEFFAVFFGGIGVGLVLAWICGLILGLVRRDPLIELTLTTILAYASFLIAEHVLHVSGVMATVMAGLTMGGWGRTKISPSVAHDLHRFWELLAYMANALIFLLVGLSINLISLAQSIGILALVVAAMLISRVVSIFGLVALVGRLSEPVDRRYQAVMYWGGLRGAIALAIALHLPDEFQYKDTFFTVVAGAVLFSLLVQGLTIERLVRKLGLDRPTIAERLARLEGLIAAKKNALKRIPMLEAGGHFSACISGGLQERYLKDLGQTVEQLETLREGELDEEQESRLLYLRCYAVEKTAYYEMFSQGHLSERAYRDLAFLVELESEAMCFNGQLPDTTMFGLRRRRLRYWLLRCFERLPGAGGVARRIRARHAVRQYERALARLEASDRVLAYLDGLAGAERGRAELVHAVRDQYEKWREGSCRRRDGVAEQFPEFVHAMQQLAAERMAVHAQYESIEMSARSGMIPGGVAEEMLEQLASTLQFQQRRAFSELHIDPSELLRKVRLFEETPADEFDYISGCLIERTIPAGEDVVREGDHDNSMFLIARGVIRVIGERDGQAAELNTLAGGDFFGEMALLTGEPRSATCRAVTVCALYELRRDDLDKISDVCPAMAKSLVEAIAVRAKDVAWKTRST